MAETRGHHGCSIKKGVHLQLNDLIFFKGCILWVADGHWHGSEKELSAKKGNLQKSHRHDGYNHDKDSAKLLNREERKIVAGIMWGWRRNVRGIKKIYP